MSCDDPKVVARHCDGCCQGLGGRRPCRHAVLASCRPRDADGAPDGRRLTAFHSRSTRRRSSLSLTGKLLCGMFWLVLASGWTMLSAPPWERPGGSSWARRRPYPQPDPRLFTQPTQQPRTTCDSVCGGRFHRGMMVVRPSPRSSSSGGPCCPRNRSDCLSVFRSRGNGGAGPRGAVTPRVGPGQTIGSACDGAHGDWASGKRTRVAPHAASRERTR